jgi:Flp pilus assembly pilin Flp
MLFLPGEEGQGLVEYALIITSIAILVMLALLLAGVNLLALYADVTESIGSLLGIGTLYTTDAQGTTAPGKAM